MAEIFGHQIKNKNIKEGFLFIAAFMFFVLLVHLIAADNHSPIGFNYTINGDNETYIWNNGSIKQDWYYSGKCLNTLSNIGFHNSTWWEKLRYGFSYGNNITELISNYEEFDPQSCNREDNSDFLTYSQLRAFKNITVGGKTAELSKTANILTNDDYMNETYRIKAFTAISQNVYFVIHRTDLHIGGNYANDWIRLKTSNGSIFDFELSSHSGTDIFSSYFYDSFFFLFDNESRASIGFQFENNNWNLVVINKELYFVFNAGTFSAGQEKQLYTQWIDAFDECACLAGTSGSTSIQCRNPATCGGEVGDIYQMDCKATLSSGFCFDCGLDWQRNASGTWATIPSSGSPIDCTGISCIFADDGDDIFREKNITCESKVENQRTRCFHNRFGASSEKNVNCVILDTIPPNVTIEEPSPTDGEIITDTTATINISVVDNFPNVTTFIDFDRDLLAYYSFDNISGNTILDEGSWGNNGTWNDLFGGSPLTGTIVNFGTTLSCFSFRQNYVSVPDGSEMDLLGNWTLQIHFHRVTDGDNEYLLSRNALKAGGFGIRTETVNDYMIFRINDTNTRDLINISSVPAVSSPNWQLLTVRYNGSHIQIIKDINEVQENSTKACTGCIINGSSAYNICSRDGIANYGFFRVDEFKIFNRSLTDVEIEAVYNTTNKGGKFEVNFNNLDLGEHRYRVYSQDRAFNKNWSNIIYFNVSEAAEVVKEPPEILPIIIKGQDLILRNEENAFIVAATKILMTVTMILIW